MASDVEMERSSQLRKSNRHSHRWAVRTIATFAIVATALATSIGVAAAAEDRPGPCGAVVREEGETVRAHSRELIRCAVRRWSVPGGSAVALCIARRESGLLPWAESADGINKGLYQQHVSYWSGNYDNYTAPSWQLRRSILNGRTNAIVSVRMAHDIGWGPWGGRNCGD